MISVVDTLRLIVAVVGGIVAVYQGALIRQAGTPGQRARLAGIAFAALVLAGSRMQNLGAPLSWQLVGSLLAIGLLAYGSWRWRYEQPATPRRPHHQH